MKITQVVGKISIKSLFILLKKAQAVVQKECNVNCFDFCLFSVF
jgi:hypothetical protein